MNSPKNKIDKRTDILVMAFLILAVGVAAFIDHRYLGFYAWAVAAIIAILAYRIGVQVGMKRKPNGNPHN